MIISTGDIRRCVPSFSYADTRKNGELLHAAQLGLTRSSQTKRQTLSEPRDNVIVNAKVFLSRHANSSQIREAVDAAIAEIGVDNLDTFVIGLPQGYEGDFKKLWAEMETSVIQGKTYNIGVSDFSEARLDELFSYAKVQPKCNQISLDAATTSMLTFAKQHDLDLLTHPVADAHVDIDNVDLGSVIPSENAPTKAAWAVRYEVSIRCRSLLATKGYLIQCAH
eukprot:TRINITY_DN3697_c0_g1_i1.p1 TRINITY_DN3697_c0_g1~~TRINITY_DN3697_c0_g1_i1.p1  ORF type:complete len:237 (+),score=34.01 TRINITY_DN3697_c0_g1_i1:44-712(+)